MAVPLYKTNRIESRLIYEKREKSKMEKAG